MSTLLLHSASLLHSCLYFFFFFNDPATTEIYTLSLHDALPIWSPRAGWWTPTRRCAASCSSRTWSFRRTDDDRDRKSTRLNSSHQIISYAVFCLKKKKKKIDKNK